MKRQALRSPPLVARACAREPYSVLARLSPSYPQLLGRLPTRYAPLRHCPPARIATHGILVRLACLIHAASVRSEPESNSPLRIEKNRSPRKATGPQSIIIGTAFAVPGVPDQTKPHHFRLEVIRMNMLLSKNNSHPACFPPAGKQAQ